MAEHPVLDFIRGKLPAQAGPFALLAEFEAMPGRGDAVAAAITASRVVPLTRAEAGCTAYDLGRDADRPDRFVAHECWADLAALEAHLATAHFAAVGAALQGLLAGAPTIRVLTTQA